MARKRNLIAALALIALIPGLAVAADAPPPAAKAVAPTLPSPALVQIGSAYVAKQLCSCLFVAGRSEASCRPEFKPQIDAAKVVVDRCPAGAGARGGDPAEHDGAGGV